MCLRESNSQAVFLKLFRLAQLGMSGNLSPTKRESLISEILNDEEELQKLLNKKNELITNLHELDAKIYRLETSYLEETRTTGNVIKGFDQYMVELSSSGNHSTQPPNLKRNLPLDPTERIFSNSSARPFGGLDKKLDKSANSSQPKSSYKRESSKDHEATSYNKIDWNRSKSDRTSPVLIRLPNARFSQNESKKTSETLTPPRIRITLRTSPQDAEHAPRETNEDEPAI